MSGFTKAWLVWGAASVLGFAVIEAEALRPEHEHEMATLSAHLRKGFGFDDSGPLPAARRSVFYVAWGWFGLHILRRTTQCVSGITAPIPLP